MQRQLFKELSQEIRQIKENSRLESLHGHRNPQCIATRKSQENEECWNHSNELVLCLINWYCLLGVNGHGISKVVMLCIVYNSQPLRNYRSVFISQKKRKKKQLSFDCIIDPARSQIHNKTIEDLYLVQLHKSMLCHILELY